ncbi:MAG: D-alanyl-D-alanine carboxypeptidase family protein [Clostridia bacterium]|nr:D-alanyl-D-alanine carboxypeptidase family protein [Clostridia bacterium]
MTSKRKQAIIRRRIFICVCIAVIVMASALIGVVISAISKAVNSDPADTSAPAAPTDKAEDTIPYEDTVSINEYGLDTKYERLILVNPDNPLPEDFDYEGNLTEIPAEYINGSLNQIDKDIWPYLKAMMDKALEDGVRLYVRSPYRSYSTQQMLYNNQVNKQLNLGVEEGEAYIKAATIVARPGTSEHHTGLAVDFNIADISFEGTEMSDWLKANAQDFGFILRYPENKTDITKVIYEPWHYRFVGIDAAKEIKELGVTFEEYMAKSN